MATGPDQWTLAGLLAEPRRRAVYAEVCSEQTPVTREQIADRLGISRSLAAFHLDRLVEAGLLDADHGQPPEGSRRKLGRPAKRYRRSGCDVELTLPVRRYDVAGRLFAAALSASQAGEPPATAAGRLARAEGFALAASSSVGQQAATGTDGLAVAGLALDELGYAPVRDGDRTALRNCPFAAIVAAAPAVTCEMNVALVEGLLAGLAVDRQVAAAFRPQAGSCCVTLTTIPTEAA